MQNIFIEFLPPWVETGIQPAFYDKESGTVLQQTARMYAKVNELVKSVNDQNETIIEYINKFNELHDYVYNYFDNLDVQEEINNKLDEMAEAGTLAEIMAEYATTKVSYYHITSETSKADLLSAFASEETKVIELDPGTYDLDDDNLFITSNTTINMNGATITGHIIFFYPLDTEVTGFDGVHNVTFNNGKIGCSCELMHNSNIVFNGIEFLETVTQHALAIGGGKDIKINNCIFDGNVINDTIKESNELIQLESCLYDSKPYLPENSPAYDGTGNKNIYIEGCYFKKGNGTTSCYYTAIGHHGPSASNEGIFIKNCQFESCRYAMITPCQFFGCIIEGCTFDQSDYIADVWLIKFRFTNKDIIVKNNTFKGGKYNICNYNLTNVTDENLIIDGNTFYTEATDASSNIEVRNWVGVIIKNNTFYEGGSRNVYVGSQAVPAVNTSIINNHFDNTKVATQCIFINYADGVDIRNNMFALADNNIRGINANASHASNISVSDNSVSGKQILLLSGVTDYTNIFGSYRAIYSGGASYTALTGQSPSIPFNNFNTLLAKVQKSGDASYFNYVEIHSDSIEGKIGTRSFGLIAYDGSSTKCGTLTINANGTFDYSSSDSLVLREIYGINR